MNWFEPQLKPVSKIFQFSFPFLSDESKKYDLSVQIKIPYQGDPSELCYRIVEKFSVPPSVEEELEEALTTFINKETDLFFNEPAGQILDKIISKELNIDDVADKWDEHFKETRVEYGDESNFPNDEELFSTVYHKLVHSPALETILQVEHSYADVIREIIRKRDDRLQRLTTKQTNEMTRAVDGVDVGLSEADVTALAARHLEEHGMEVAKWGSRLDSVRESQRREYRDWLMSLVEQSCGSDIPTPLNSPIAREFERPSDSTRSDDELNLQESFTIHLGSQMKQMYNIRILVSDPLELCRLRLSPLGELAPEQPQRLQTALALYSNDLCGLVLLTDNYLGSFSGITKDFIKICESSTELHFSSVEDQIEKIRSSVKEGVEWRRSHAAVDAANQLTSSELMSRRSGTKYLQTGDVYMTKHSNLSEVHVVFHMVTDDSLKSNDINSRHPTILGLRNILKCACSYDVTTLTIPLLLCQELTEEMNLTWCTKRAELIYKCVKGFMIEMASWCGSELKNLQFIVPRGIDEEVFNCLATMLPTIFRVSNPLVLKGTSSPQHSIKESEKETNSKDKKNKKSKKPK